MMFSWPLMPKSPRIVPGAAFAAVCSSGKAAHYLYSIFSFKAHDYDRIEHHRIQQERKKWAVYKVGIVLT